MEPLWSPVVATGGNRSQMQLPQEPQKHAKAVAVGCDRLPFRSHGKEGVDGSSPPEGSAKALLRRVFSLPPRWWKNQFSEHVRGAERAALLFISLREAGAHFSPVALTNELAALEPEFFALRDALEGAD